jgi:hypothetical protein
MVVSRRNLKGMMTFTELTPAASDLPEPFTDRLRLAVAACLRRFKGSSRAHTESTSCVGSLVQFNACQCPDLPN